MDVCQQLLNYQMHLVFHWMNCVNSGIREHAYCSLLHFFLYRLLFNCQFISLFTNNSVIFFYFYSIISFSNVKSLHLFHFLQSNPLKPSIRCFTFQSPPVSSYLSDFHSLTDFNTSHSIISLYTF